jgi:ATP-GRASP peptide maturase of grasp-with-spasm system
MSKIVIFSEDSDYTTAVIMKWILFCGNSVERINRDDKNLSVISMNAEKLVLQTSFKILEVSRADVVWFRRGGAFSFYILKPDEKNIQKRTFELQERKNVFDSLTCWLINNCVSFGNPFYAEVNKTDVLEKAEKAGLNVPEWIITNNKNCLLPFMNRYEKIITKTFTALNYTDVNFSYKNLTNLLNINDVEKIPNNFSSLFFQRYINKKYELRIFFFENKFFSMAILSQKDEKTKVDFRDYNKEKPNRRFPFALPKLYENKLQKLAKMLHLDTGSFDVMIDNEDRYYFLEVNPVGQFGMTSIPCNYSIEKYIAEILIQKNNEITK